MKRFSFLEIIKKCKAAAVLVILSAAFIFASGCGTSEKQPSGETAAEDNSKEREPAVKDDISQSDAFTETDSAETEVLVPDEEDSIMPEEGSTLDSLLLTDFLTPNEYSRPGDALTEVNGVVVHFVNNAGTTAQENRNYFESLMESGETYASSHYIIGLEGEIIQCIPLSEIAYCSNERNNDTISIECCHPDDTGVYTEATYNSLVELTAWLCGKFGLSAESVIRHFDVTGKLCPKAFVLDEGYWYGFKADIAFRLKEDELTEQYFSLAASLAGVPSEEYTGSEDKTDSGSKGSGGRHSNGKDRP